MEREQNAGFTLIELSIVLVIIGLIIGGVLVGRDLISTAAARAQIAQIEKYASAVNTFRTKYNALPGDITAPNAAAVGLHTRSGSTDQGDGDGQIEDLNGTMVYLGGEMAYFWMDLSSAQLVDGGFVDPQNIDSNGGTVFGNSMAAYYQYVPAAKIGNNGAVFVFANTLSSGIPKFSGLDFEVGVPNTTIVGGTVDLLNGVMTPLQASYIDSKIDDGSPLTGRVIAAAGGRDGSSGNSNWTLGANVSTNAGFTGAAAKFCVSAAPYTYNVQNTGQSCNLLFSGQ